MSQIISPLPQPPDTAQLLDELVGGKGTGAHPYVRSGALSEAPEAMRNLADAVHFLCLLHGRHPGVVDSAALKNVDPEARAWLEEAVEAFADERAFLSHIAAAVGPVPSTPGQAQSEATVAAQRRALDMLAQSDRHGCAVGAALALTLDWCTIRVLLDISAARLDLAANPSHLPDLRATAALAARLGASPPIQRAMLFGAKQLLLQHQGLWDLMMARAKARGTI
ncbi:DUF6975 family protein [Sphingopyxis sp. MWB1]|uniref:DUF6975 family protein n=1 Tax=Sphingopyxis sp. MWB1 TaxID=1537715 RepID=UPI00051A45F1|nr:hypothetical protein [Sphingopyxis sp. MWB1]